MVGIKFDFKILFYLMDISKQGRLNTDNIKNYSFLITSGCWSKIPSPKEYLCDFDP